jgi:hypothetical protein
MLKSKRIVIVASLIASTGLAITPVDAAQLKSSSINEIQASNLVLSANYLLDKETSYLPGTSLSKVRRGKEVKSNGTKFKENSLPEVKSRASIVTPSWMKIKANRDYSNNWCAWTASFMLRDSKIFPASASKKEAIPSSSELVRKALLTGGVKVFGPSKSISGFTVKPGDLVAYYSLDSEDTEGGKKITLVRLVALINELLNAPGVYNNKGTDADKATRNRPFDHTGVVVFEQEILEGNRGGKLRVSRYPDVSGYDGLVIIRPSW